MPQRSLIASLAIACLVFGASCFNEAKAPSIVPTRTLGLAPEAVPEAKAGPVSVAFASSSPVGVVFDRAMRGAEAGGAVRVKITAVGAGLQPAGAWRWVGRSALVFAPSARLPSATEYEVTVEAGAQAVDGSVLAAPYAFRFSTGRPALVSLDPREGQISLLPAFELRFSEPVSPEEVTRAAHLVVGESSPRGTTLEEVRVTLADRFGIKHVTVQLELDECGDGCQ